MTGGAELGYDVPALVGMAIEDVITPALIVDLDALERNIRRMGEFVRTHGMRHRVHGKMHKSVDVARLQIEMGGAQGVCCQKVSEAEVFVRGGIADILVSNEVRQSVMIDRLARLPAMGAQVSVCVDDPANVAELSEAAGKHGTELGVLVELDCGAGRCGVITPEAAIALAQAISNAPNLRYEGLQAYQGSMQHIEAHDARAEAARQAHAIVREVVDALRVAGLNPPLVTGGGTGSYAHETASGLYNELQCGSYAFMDADYGRIRDEQNERLDVAEWENALFVLTSVVSATKPSSAVCDVGLKASSVDSGLPVVFGTPGVTYTGASDEHGSLDDPDSTLQPGDQLRLVPGHCDPTCNLHDWYVGVRDSVVETLWPVSARGKGY